MRLRLAELLKEHDMTAYELAKASGGRISLAAIYRLSKQEGRARYYDANLLQAMCDVFRVKPGELFESERGARRPPAKRK